MCGKILCSQGTFSHTLQEVPHLFHCDVKLLLKMICNVRNVKINKSYRCSTFTHGSLYCYSGEENGSGQSWTFFLIAPSVFCDQDVQGGSYLRYFKRHKQEISHGMGRKSGYGVTISCNQAGKVGLVPNVLLGKQIFNCFNVFWFLLFFYI